MAHLNFFLRKIIVLLLLFAGDNLMLAQAQKNTPAPSAGIAYFSDPALSPDATEIAFVSGGDIWTVSSNGGEARLLVSHASYDSRPVYSPDGRYLAFTSSRSGNGDIYVLDMASGQLKRLTYDDGLDEINAWSGDGKYIYFSSTSRDISGMRDAFRVAMQGGTPMPVSANRYVSEFFPMPSPDGKTLALTVHGVASQQWWRKGHSHLDESEIWLMHDGGSYEKVTGSGAKYLWPMWSNDGKSLYYISDETGIQNLYVQPLNGAAKQLTQFENGRVLWPTISYNGNSVVFERDFKIWLYNVASGKVAPVNIIRRGSPATPGVEHVLLTNQFRELVLSPDGKKVAFTVRGDIFIASAKDGGEAVRVTNTTGIESQIAWANNSNNIVYTSDRDGSSHIYQYNFISKTESRLTNGTVDDAAPKFSPDGKMLAFVRDAQEIRILSLPAKNEILLTKGYIGRPLFTSPNSYNWSPDGKWIAYAAFGPKSFRNIYIIPTTGGESKPISFLANAFTDGVTWSKDNKYILFNTSQRTENGFVARVDLVPQRPRFKEDQFQNMFIDQVPATPTLLNPSNNKVSAATDTMFKNTIKGEKEQIKIVWDGIRQRLNFIPLGVDVNEQTISPDGNTLLVTASVAGQDNLFTYSLDEFSKDAAVLKQITATSLPKSSAQFSPDGKEVFFIEQGRIQSVTLDSRQVKPLPVTAELDIDFNKEKLEIFKQTWELQNKAFYDPTFHGADWDKVKQTYEPLAAGANTPDELRRILSLMIGELNASHSGVSGPPAQFNVGRLGLRFNKDEYENNGRLKINEVIALSPAALSGNINEGDYLLAIDGTTISSATNVDQLLENKINKMVTLNISSSNADKEGLKINMRPINNPAEKGLLYKQWVQQQREYVNKVSKGRLGYVHMFDMSQESLNQLYIDMDAENHSREGVVVDIRNNNGGFVNAYALDVLSRKGYMTMTIRGLPSSPARLQLGQRSLEAPTILVTNQHSLSDAEDFSEGYRTLKLGKVVGEPTGGWIIYTTNVPLFDGTTVRLPFIKVTDHEGKDMELHPRPVDIAVSNPLGEKNKDSQLDAAVKELLKQVDETRSKSR